MRRFLFTKQGCYYGCAYVCGLVITLGDGGFPDLLSGAFRAVYLAGVALFVAVACPKRAFASCCEGWGISRAERGRMPHQR